ncbi:MAG TPA: hypothetical protein VEA61_12430 [Allosphingosinicella sp.]|nr:hypothetical protein [Allosphingosinicella sp.]
MKSFAFACLALLAACAEPPEPQADPAVVERIARANTSEAPRLAKADRLIKAVDRADPDRLAGPAEALLER